MNAQFTRFTQKPVGRRTFAALAACALTGLTATQAGAAHATTRASGATTGTPTIYSVPYDDDLFMEFNNVIRRLTFDDWRDMGFPEPIPAPTDYLRLHWSKVVYAIHPWLPDRNLWGSHIMSDADLHRVGYPKVGVTAWLPNVHTYTYASSDEVFASVGFDPTVHKLTLDEWIGLGAPEPSRYPDQVLKLPWLDTLFMVQSDGTGFALTAAAWDAYANPTPMTVPSFPGGAWYSGAGGEGVMYINEDLDFFHIVTPEEYARAGYPPLGADLG